ncbi:MAG: hypothetical protein KAK04_18390, partial [Cyclobacteriaceae bacterium]|nr:hypothetical protein [Cyclobacteriaceae bacterium]
EELSDTIRATLISEIKLIDSTLNIFINVADSLNKSMSKSEHKAVYKQGNFYNLILNYDPTIQQNVKTSSGINNLPWNYRVRRFLKKNGEFVDDGSQNDFNFSIADLPYKYYKLIFNLDATGQQKVQTSSRIKTVSSWDNYSFRRYFKESGEWELDSLKIMLDFIVSNTSGEKLGVVSERGGKFIYAITSRLYSVINTILPLGYGFCVIDKMGDVKFHSNSGRMLQENFIEESENSSDLKQAIYGNLDTHFSANYVGKSHLCYVQPIKALPLYLVTFYDESYLHSVNLKTTNLTFIFSLLVLVMFFLMVMGSWFVIHKKTELNRNLDLIEWIKPTKRNIKKSRNI